jgi:E3 ubiquitin-protein ligase TRIP12
MVCGAQPDDKEFTDKEGLMKNIIPDHGYTKNSDQYIYFIRYITEMEPAFRNQFIKFLTGSKRLPIGGFKSLDPKMTFVKQDLSSQEPDSSLPSVMACLNYVKSPGYSSYEVFKMKYDYSVENG